jgi:4a-hydroxytetrahydrobiopterin dehydratase
VCALQGGEKPLEEPLISEYLEQLHGEWRVEEARRLVREVKLGDFMGAIDLINRVSHVAEEEGHHPNVALYDWNKVKFELYTHKIGGLHENDFILAKRIDGLLMD